MIAFIDAHKDSIMGGRRWGAESICEVLQVAPSSYYAARSRPVSRRTERDEELKVEIARVYR